MNIGEMWRKLEDAWYALLDRLEDKGIPVYKLVDPLEERGIPSLPVFLGIMFIIIAGIAWSLTPAPGGGGTLAITVKSGDLALEGANIAVSLDGELLGTWKTDEKGKVSVEIPGSGKLEITVTKEGCEEIKKEIEFTGGEKFLTLKTNCMGIAPESCLNIPEELNALPLLTPGGQPVSNCKVYLVRPDGTSEELSWEVTEDGYLIIGAGDCLTSDERIRISCSGYSGEFYADELLDYAEVGEPIYLSPGSPEFSADSNFNGVPDYLEGNATSWQGTDFGDYWGTSEDVDDNGNGIPDTYEADNYEAYKNYMLLSVTVLDKDTGQRLDGIEVRAVDANGTLLPGNQTSATTEDGVALLRVPRQKLALQAVDPNGVYATFTTQPFFPTGFTTLRLAKGWPSTVWVKQPDGRGIPGVTVTINGVRVFTDYQGKAVLSLERGRSYTVYAYKEGYKPASGTLVGGEELELVMEQLTDNNSGPLTLEILNPSRADDPFPEVQVKLISKDGLLGGECETGANGRCSWTRIYATTYSVLAKPPMAYEYEEVGTLDVKAGRTNFYSFELYPVTMEIRVRTLVDGKPSDDVKLTLYRTYPDIEEVDKGTSKNSYVSFEAYWGNEYYITGSWQNKTTRYYATLGPFKLDSRKDLEINLEKPETKIELSVPKTAKRGSRVYGKLTIGLPYLDEKKKTIYDQVIVEIWAGEPGDKEDPELTPVLIDKVPELVRMSETSQVPKIGILGFSSYQEDLSGKTDLSVETSKGLRILITNYKPGNLELDIPFLVRIGGLADATKIHYHAIYESKEARFDTGWKENVLKITGTSDWNEIPEGDFYLFKAGLTLTPDSDEWQDQVTGTVDSVIYLHVNALARDYSERGRVDLAIDPEILEPMYFWGEISNGTKTWEIEKTEISGTSFDVMEGAMKRELEPDDLVNVTIALKVLENGTANIIPFFDEYERTDNPPVLTVKAVNVDWEPTPIPGVEGAITGQVHFTLDNLPTGYSGEDYWGTFKDYLPLFSQNKSVPRDFQIIVYLKNSAQESYSADLEVEAYSDDGQPVDLNLDYPTTVDISPGTSQIVITGTGPEEPISGEIRIWIWQGERPSEPWVTISFEPNDYFIYLVTNNTYEDKMKKLENVVTQFTASGYIQAYDGMNDLEPLDYAWFNGAPASKMFLNNEQVFSFTTQPLEPGQEVNVQVKSDSIYLTKPFRVQGAAVEPEPTIFSETQFNDNSKHWETTITIVNYWNDELRITPKLWDYLQDYDIFTGFDSNKYNYYNFLVYANKYDQDGMAIPPLNITNENNIELEPGQIAVIHWSIEPAGSAANDYQVTAKLELKLEAGGMKETLEYFKNVSSALSVVEAPEEVSGQFEAGNYTIMRDFTDPRSVSYTASCQAVIDPDSGYLTNAYICDASQIAYVISDLLDTLEKSDEKYLLGGPYAFGNDYLSANEISDISDKTIKELKITVNGAAQDKLSCGVINLLAEKNPDGTFNIKGNIDPGMPWCQPGFPSFFLGLINPDTERGLNTETITMPYAFEDGSDDFEYYLDDVLKDNKKEILGYEDIITNVPPIKDNWYTIKWQEVNAEDVSDSENTELKWVKTSMGDSKVVGFIRWYPEDYSGVGRLANTYLMGVMYSSDMADSKDTLEDLAKCFVANLVYHWITGNSSFIDESDVRNGVVIPLDTCTRPDIGSIIRIPSYNFSIYTIDVKDITGDWTGNDTVWIQVSNQNSNVNIDYCYAGVGRVDTSQQIPWSDIGDDYYQLTGLEEGKNTIYVECVSEDGVMGPVIEKEVYVDTQPPSILGKNFVGLSLGIGKCCEKVVYTVTESGSGVESCGVYAVYNDAVSEVKLGYCTEKFALTTGAYEYECVIGTTDWNNPDTLAAWNGTADSCKKLPLHMKVAVVCKDKVGNEGKQLVNVQLTGSYISIEPAEDYLVECPVLLSGGSISENAVCLFSPAAKDATSGEDIFYTNAEGEKTVYFHVISAAEVTGCSLVITQNGQIIDETTGRIAEGSLTDGIWAFTFNIPQNEGEYTVTVTCRTSDGTPGTGTDYQWVGDCGSTKDVWNGYCSTNCQVSSTESNSNSGGYACQQTCTYDEDCIAYCESKYGTSSAACTGGCCSCMY